MSTHLDIIGSVIIAGMIILNFAFFMGERQDSQIKSVNKVTQQGDISDMSTTMRHDLMKVGFGCDTLKVLCATANEFTFRSDLDNNGKLDTISYRYALGDTSQQLTTSAGGYLYRIINGRRTRGADLGFVSFGFRYYSLGTKKELIATTTAADVKSIAVAMRVQSAMSSSEGCQYEQSDFTVSPKNLK